MVRCYVKSKSSRLTHLAPRVLRTLYINVGSRFISRRHGRWYSCSLVASRCCPAEALCRPTRRRQCVPLHIQTGAQTFNSSSPSLTVKGTKTPAVPDLCSPLMKVEPAEPATLLGTILQGKREKALGKRKAKPAAVLPPRYSEEHSGEEHVSKPTKRPALTLVERQGREKQDGEARRQGFAASEIEHLNGTGVEAMGPPLLHDQSGSSSDSSVPLAKKHAVAKSKRARSLAGTRTKPKTSKEEASPLPTKRRGRPKVKVLPRSAEGSSDKATNITETVDTGPRRKTPSVAEERDAEPETVPHASSRRRKVAQNANPRPPTTTRIEIDSGGVGGEVQVLQGKIAPAPAKVPRKRKERVKASSDKDDNNNDDEHEYEKTHGLPLKKRQRADLTARYASLPPDPRSPSSKTDCNIMYCSRNAKENKEMSRSAREAGAMDRVRPSFFVLLIMHSSRMPSAEGSFFPQPIPSPVKKPARATPNPPSKAKAKAKTAKPRSRAGASGKSGTRPRGLPLDVRRRIEVIARNPLETDVDDDDPIDFLR
jgi:hypothetical protein